MKNIVRSVAGSAAFAMLGLIAGACGGVADSQHDIDAVEQTVTGCAAPTFVVKTYAAGDQVQTNGVLYQCKPYPYTGWCGIGGPYEPGVGSNWTDAWIQVGPCGTGGTTGAPSAPPAGMSTGGSPGGSTGGGGTCNLPAWQQGHSYVTGDKVIFQGNAYIAEHDNPGYDPTVSTWFWDPYAGCSPASSGGSSGTTGAGSGNTGASCSYPPWQAGRNYATGDKVTYGGSGYIAVHDNPGYDPTISTWFWDPFACGSGTTTGSGSAGGGITGAGSGFASIVGESQFNSMFPGRNSFYTYQGLVDATASYPAFASTGDAATEKREAAAFLANVAHETGNLVYIDEIVKGDYCAPSAGCSCAPGKQYYGRGPLQLSWSYNYCAAGAALHLDLQADPDLISRSSTVAWQTGLWFWMTQTGAGRMTAHDGIVGGAFGETIRTINGGLECGGANPSEMQSRINNYVRFCQILGVDPGSNQGC